VSWHDSTLMVFTSYVIIVSSVTWLLLWSAVVEGIKSKKDTVVDARSNSDAIAQNSFKNSTELEARVREAATFKAELMAKQEEIAALKAGLSRADTAVINEAIADFFIAYEFERRREEGSSSNALDGMLQPMEQLLAAACLVKGYPNPGERFVDQPAGTCKVFKTEPAGSPELKGTIKVVRSPWVGFMVNGKLKVIVACNISVYA